MNFCLSDLVPPLRWSDATGFSQLREAPGLPDAWWRAMPISRVFAVLDPEALGELLTELALDHWPAAAVGDILPALHVMDPDEADDPQVSIALDRVGSWFGLLSLTGRELADQPFIRARPVLTALFTAVFVRLSSGEHDEEHEASAPLPMENAPEPLPIEKAAAPFPVEPLPLEKAAGPFPVEPLAVEKPAAGVFGDLPVPQPDPFAGKPPLPKRRPTAAAAAAAAEQSDPLGLAAARMAEAVLEQRTAKSPFDAGRAEPTGPRTSMFTPPPRPERPQPPEGLPFGSEVPSFGRESSPFGPPTAAPRPFIPEPEGFTDPAAMGAEPAMGGDGGYDDLDAAAHLEAPEGVPLLAAPVGTSTDDLGGVRADGDLAALIDEAFADLDDKTWAVAQNHLFTDAPAAPEELAKLFAVTPDEILALEEELRARVAAWLESDEAAPYTQHLEKLSGALGIAAPKSRLMAAADWHTRQLRSLDVPAWQFVLATLPGYTVQDDWLVAGDIAELREQTCGLILNADRPPTVARALELVSTLGIHPEVAKEWLENVPQLRIQSTKKAAVSADAADRPADPLGPPSGPTTGPLKDVAMTRRCFRQPDGLWWLRIDVTPDHLGGAECRVPSGFAAYLGMSPGDDRTVTSAAGDITLSWQARPVIDSLGQLLHEMGAQPGSHLFLTVAEDDTLLRARLVPAAAGETDKNTLALRLAGYTTGGQAESLEETIRVLATRIGMTGPVGLPELMNRLRERGDRDLLSLMV
ncbi:hypothetical protein [Sphaerisporangium fuscum]|uniref:hypothetical protein n=1 Tax=Sphaerisporangium fuscum TaxID=2835868 RepID=UPI001BDD370B|nr:hypothetical protein [Sphaerisporangium fuscum]